MSRRARLCIPFVSVLVALLLAPAIGRAATTDAEVQRGLRGLVAAKGGPPGAIATLYRDGRLTTLSAGRSNI
jgi:D-alanyl-D-alanine carboxypeptidase